MSEQSATLCADLQVISVSWMLAGVMMMNERPQLQPVFYCLYNVTAAVSTVISGDQGNYGVIITLISWPLVPGN